MLNIYYHQLLEMKKRKIANIRKNSMMQRIEKTPMFFK